MHNFSFTFILSVSLAISSCQNQSARNFDSGCGEVFTAKQFIIDSPSYPSNYPTNSSCSYLIKGPSCPTRFNLQFLDFSIEDSLGCSKDRLEIEDKDAICGNKNNEVKNYFSEKGTLLLNFVSDGDNTGRGYRILVTRSACVAPEVSPKWYTTSNDVEYTTTKRPIHGKCCQTLYTSKMFTLTSPNFPYSTSSPSDCLFEIHKSSPLICRLRIHVKFFWLGRDNSCREGFLEIDGKRICGCKSDLKIVVPFEQQSMKTLRFVSYGYEKFSYSGFVMEVIQDECPKKVVPGRNVTLEKRFRFYNDQINRVSWPNKSQETVIEKLHLISENTEVLPDFTNATHGRGQPRVVKYVYFYAFPDLHRIPREREDTDYVDTSSSSTSFQNNVDYSYCQNWNQMQFNNLRLRNLPVCKTNAPTVGAKKCVDLRQERGLFKSPGYPVYYPGNLNVCYRFHKLPGYCSVRVYMQDFNLQKSATCENDYLIFANNLRYCGNALMNTVSTFELRDKPYEEMTFITDAFYCGRGFFGSYKQLPCQEYPHPINPVSPPPPSTPCSRTIQEEMFTLEVYDYNEPSCAFGIKKFKEEVCSVTLVFERFDLTCAAESLVIDGTMYCGHLTGQSVKIDVTRRDAVIVYKRSTNAGVKGIRLRIKGLQEECPYPEVPAERLLSNDNKARSDKFIVKLDKDFKNICGIITNVTQSRLPKTFCDIIMKSDNNVTMCLPLEENAIIVPVGSQKIELKIRDVDRTDEIEFKEVDCDDLNN